MQSLEGSSNEELLASLAGRPAAARLMGKFEGLSSLAQASFADLQQVPGVGPSKAAAIFGRLEGFLTRLDWTNTGRPMYP